MLDSYDADGDNKITQRDLNNIDYIYLFNVKNYTGLKTMYNMKDLRLEGFQENKVIFNCTMLQNMNDLEEFSIKKLGAIYNTEKLNNFPKLKFLEFTSENTFFINNLKELKGLNNVTLRTELIKITDNDVIDTFAEELESVEVKRILFKNLYRDIELEEPIKIGGQKTYTFDELNPFISKYILNKDSKMYNEDFVLFCNGNKNIVIDNDKKTITIKSLETDEEGVQEVDISYIYYIDGYYPDYTFKLKYSLSNDGVYDEEPLYKIGDVNNDGTVNTTDCTIILRYLKGYEELNETELLEADVNKDGTVNTTDCTIILRYLKGYEELN